MWVVAFFVFGLPTGLHALFGGDTRSEHFCFGLAFFLLVEGVTWVRHSCSENDGGGGGGGGVGVGEEGSG